MLIVYEHTISVHLSLTMTGSQYMNNQTPLKDDTVSVHLSLMTGSQYVNTQMPLKDDKISVHLSLMMRGSYYTDTQNAN